MSDAAVIERALQRERAARKQAETLLDEKSRELYQVNKTLEAQADELSGSLDELRRTQAQLIQASKMESLGTLAGGIAHEINTPIQYIGDNLNFLSEAFEDIEDILKEAKKLVDAGGDSVANLSAALDEADIDLLLEEIPDATEQSLGGVAQVGRIVLAMKEFAHPSGAANAAADLNHVIDNALTVSSNEWKHAAELEFIPDSSLPLVICQEGEIGQVILNIVVNAAHAIADKSEGGAGQIKVMTRLAGPNAEIEISDNGTGIPEDIISVIFEPFFTTKGVGKGTGQGLAISYDIITKKHGGELTVENVPGAGARFLVKLPIEGLGKSDG
jgi:two-component system, NtrC family, sensor kinase